MEIIHYPNDILNKIAEPLPDVNDVIIKITDNMVKLMHKSKGIGLAAPQVGLSLQAIIINPTNEEGKDEIYLNPKILKKKGRIMGEEGCLSVPSIYGNVFRAEWVKVSVLTLSGEERIFELEGFPARVMQHEIDHLKGILFVEKIQPAEKVTIKNSLKALEEIYYSKK